MAGRERWRLLVVLLALVSLATMMVHYAAAEPDSRQGPSGAALAADYERHVGERIAFWSTVVAVRGGTFEVERGRVRLTVVGSDAAVNPGDTVEVYGTLRPNRRLAAERVLVSPTENRLYMFAVSTAAVGVALGAFLRHWRLDRRRLAFVPRDRTRDETNGADASTGRTGSDGSPGRGGR